MDSERLFTDMIRASLVNDFDRVEELANHLLAWLDQGGAVPQISALADMPEKKRAKMIRGVCKSHLLLVEVHRKLKGSADL